VQPQPGIFAVGDSEHCFVELDLVPGAEFSSLVTGLAAVFGPESVVAGVNVVVGFRPDRWGSPSVRSFEEIRGDGIVMPATQHDAWFWIAGGDRSTVFDCTVALLDSLAPVAHPASELVGWPYRERRDLTGFIDGTENPSPIEAMAAAVSDDGSSVLLFQKWVHQPSWRSLPVAEQERVIGRSKPDSVQMDDDVLPADSHVSRNVVEEDGEELAIFRRNVAYGGPTDHGTVFVGFCAAQHPLDIMLRRMAGAVEDGIRDVLTRYTTPLSGAYYVIPAMDALRSYVR
jgi:putative iron-dependent peroxidase